MKNLLRALVFTLSFNALAMDPPDSHINISPSEETALWVDQESLTEYILKQYYGQVSKDMMVNHSELSREIHKMFLYILGFEFYKSSSAKSKSDLWELMQCALGENTTTVLKYSSHNLKHIKQQYENLSNSADREVLRFLDEIKSNTGDSRGKFYQLINHIFSAQIPEFAKKIADEYFEKLKKKKKKYFWFF